MVVIDVLDVVATVVALLVLVALLLIFRLVLLRRSGAVLHCALRLSSSRVGHGWHLGIVRYSPRHVQWFRIFSFAPRAKFTFARRGFEITGRRSPRGFELHSLPHPGIVVQCLARARGDEPMDLELAMGEATTNGFLAWLESSPPGAR